MQIRWAEYGDFDEIGQECRKFAESLGYMHDYLPSDANMHVFFEYWLQNHIFIVAEDDDGRIVGMICGEKAPHPFNPAKRVLYEHFWWVKPEFRRSGAGKMLIKEFMEHGRDCDAVRVHLEHNSPVSSDFLAQFGLNHCESVYIKENE